MKLMRKSERCLSVCYSLKHHKLKKNFVAYTNEPSLILYRQSKSMKPRGVCQEYEAKRYKFLAMDTTLW